VFEKRALRIKFGHEKGKVTGRGKEYITRTFIIYTLLPILLLMYLLHGAGYYLKR